MRERKRDLDPMCFSIETDRALLPPRTVLGTGDTAMNNADMTCTPGGSVYQENQSKREKTQADLTLLYIYKATRLLRDTR